MIRNPERIPVYIRQYERVPLMLGDAYDSFVGEAVLNHLLDRDALEGNTDVLPALIAADQALSAALSSADEVWWDRLQTWAAQCEFAKSLWWISVQYNARRGSPSPFSLPDALGALADAWVKALGANLSESPVRIGGVTSSFHDAMLIGVAQASNYVRGPAKHGPMLPKHLSRFAQAAPVLVLPGSAIIGFQLPREVADEPASGPATESLDALEVVMQASERYSPDGDPGAIADVVDDEMYRDRLWKSLKGIYNAVGPGAERIEIVSKAHGGQRVVSWPVHGKAVSRPHEATEVVGLVGNVRAIDLDRHSMRIQVEGAPWTTAIVAKPTLFLRIDELASLVIGQHVVVSGTTKDEARPPRTMAATEIDPAQMQ